MHLNYGDMFLVLLLFPFRDDDYYLRWPQQIFSIWSLRDILCVGYYIWVGEVFKG